MRTPEDRREAERRVEGADLLAQARALQAERLKRHRLTREAASDPGVVAALAVPNGGTAENLTWREATRRRGDVDPVVRTAARDLARRSVEYFASALAWTFDPRPDAAPNHFPFLLYPYERAFIATIEEQYRAGRDLLVEKSRDMGATWCVLLWVLHHWLFDKAFSAHLGSRKEDFVDKRGDISSHFEKLRYMLKRLPVWVLPAGFDWRTCDLDLRLINPATGNVITGEATNPDFSRQGRYSVVFLDEFASVQCDTAVASATSESTRTRVFVSTPKGVGNEFYRLRHGGKVRVSTLHWSLHPLKCDTTPEYFAQAIAEGRARVDEQVNVPPGCYRGLASRNDKGEATAPGKLRSKWYDDRCANLSTRDVAQELDVEYLGSGSAVLDLEVVRAWERSLVELENLQQRVVRTERDSAAEVYEEPAAEVDYIVTVDTAKGTGGDDSVVEAFRASPVRQAYEFCGQLAPDLLGPYAVEVAHRYNDALLVIENDGMGLATVYAARDYINAKNYAVQVYCHVDFREPNAEAKELGLSTGKCRPEMVRQLTAAVRTKALEVRSLRWIAQAYAFEWTKPDRAEAASGDKDDLILATMFVLYALLSYWRLWKRSDPLPFLFGVDDGRGWVMPQ